MVRIVKSKDEFVAHLLKQPAVGDDVAPVVQEIIARVREQGDAALISYTRRFDKAVLTPEELRVRPEEFEEAYKAVSPELLVSLRLARDRLLDYHSRQLPQSWFTTGPAGEILGQLYRPLAAVGVYVPGGTAAYPSSVLMNVIPARVAGVPRIVIVTPPRPDGKVPALVLVAAAEVGVKEVYRVGGAQAVAALAYGTATIPKVDKIVGPGNIYVTAAKRFVFGAVDIDMLAGPSEVVVVADATADPELVAADLLSQAEHDARAVAVLLTPSLELARRVRAELEAQVAELPRREIASQALAERGALIVTEDLAEAVELANSFAPEHLELYVADPFAWLGRIRNAGCVFLGGNASEPLGDYLAGPNHVLPTGGTARFFSPLGVEDFLKRTSVVFATPEFLRDVGEHVVRLAEAEGLAAHAAAVARRLSKCASPK